MKNKYILLDEPIQKSHLKMISDAVLNNAFWKEKLLPDQMPDPVAFILKNEGTGKSIDEQQEKMWGGCPVFVGIDLNSGYVHVEGSCLLYDEIYAFQGIDEYDLENCVRVADYVACIRKFNRTYYDSIL